MMAALPARCWRFCASALLLIAPTTVPAMTDEPHALTLDVREHDGTIEVQLIGLSPVPPSKNREENFSSLSLCGLCGKSDYFREG